MWGSGEEAEDPEICCIWEVEDLEHNMECREGRELDRMRGLGKHGANGAGDRT
jgi:hypothetical protein